MTLIEKCQKILNNNLKHSYNDFKNWSFSDGVLMSIHKIYYNEDNQNIDFLKIDLLIMKSSKEECKASGYARRCKRWMNNNNFQEKWVSEFHEIYS